MIKDIKINKKKSEVYTLYKVLTGKYVSLLDIYFLRRAERCQNFNDYNYCLGNFIITIQSKSISRNVKLDSTYLFISKECLTFLF